MSKLYTVMMIQDEDHRQHELNRCTQWEVLDVNDREEEEGKWLWLPVTAAQGQ